MTTVIRTQNKTIYDIKHFILEFKFLNMTKMENLRFWNNFSYCSILRLTWTFAGSWNSPQFTCQVLVEKSMHVLSLQQLKHFLCQTICVTPKL